MPTPVLTRGIAVVGLLVIVAVAVNSAQTPAGPAQPGMPELLAEVRALRAEVHQAAGASMRMQLLVARLTLQEQRITTLGRQVAEVQEKLRATTQERLATQTRGRELEEVIRSGRLSVDDERQLGYEARQVSERVAEQSAREQHLRGEESELLGAVAAEQGRWMDFNARLDELERSLPTSGH